MSDAGGDTPRTGASAARSVGSDAANTLPGANLSMKARLGILVFIVDVSRLPLFSKDDLLQAEEDFLMPRLILSLRNGPSLSKIVYFPTIGGPDGWKAMKMATPTTLALKSRNLFF